MLVSSFPYFDSEPQLPEMLYSRVVDLQLVDMLFWSNRWISEAI